MIDCILEEVPPVKPFPKLMIDGDGCIVLFTEHGCGVCIKACMGTTVGEMGRWHMPRFKDYNKPLTLVNK